MCKTETKDGGCRGDTQVITDAENKYFLMIKKGLKIFNCFWNLNNFQLIYILKDKSDLNINLVLFLVLILAKKQKVIQIVGGKLKKGVWHIYYSWYYSYILLLFVFIYFFSLINIFSVNFLSSGEFIMFVFELNWDPNLTFSSLNLVKIQTFCQA